MGERPFPGERRPFWFVGGRPGVNAQAEVRRPAAWGNRKNKFSAYDGYYFGG